MTAAKTSTTASVFGANRNTQHRQRARRVDQRQQRLHAPAADRPAHREAADDVEQADIASDQAPTAGGSWQRGDDARQVGGDEGDVEAADEEAGAQQPVARVGAAPAQIASRVVSRAAAALGRAGRARRRLRRLPRSTQAAGSASSDDRRHALHRDRPAGARR